MSANHFSSFIPDVFMASTPTEKPIHYIVTGFLLLLAFYTVTGHDQSLPEVNPRKAPEVTNRRRMNDFIHNGKRLMIQAKATFGKNPYRILSEWGSLVVLPADYLQELRNDPRLDFKTPSNDVLKPHIERRNAKKAQAVASGDTTATFDDAIEWFSQIFKGKYDPATQQITLSLVAIHTTSDLLQQTMVDLAQHPELFQPLREELVRVLGTEGLKKSALNNLKLMDSVLKESQRLKPALLCTWRRLATENIELSSGFVIRKGQRVIINNTHMWDDEWYDNAEQYDGHRFLRMRNTDEEKHAHIVSASPKHTAFGYGQHACPGRFFAANELKIALAHLLLKYDWKLSDETGNPEPVPFGMALLPDPKVKFLVRRRKEEIDLNSLEC
ncbi:Cytochrome P450 monooxygenase [Colletotrichum sp. SAR11_240]|nr:Cytochrome P450 monooxygenase [Colletotrichum sp. SAR11_240]